MSNSEIPQSVPKPLESPATRNATITDSRKHPCILCQQRKVKCDRNIPCANCTKARVDCISMATLPPRKRKKRFPEAELLARLHMYEQHLKGYGADLKAINEDALVPKHEHKQRVSKESRKDERPDFLALRRSLRKMENNLWDGVDQDFRDTEDLLQGSSEDEMFQTSITTSYQERFGGGEDFYLPSGRTESLQELHPPPVQIFQLWQIFLYSINPLIKIFHAPTVQVQILDAVSDLSCVDKNVEALMFSIYSVSIYSLSDEECRNKFDQDREALLHQFQVGARAALHRAGFLKSSDLMLLQALVLYLMSCVHFSMDPRSIFSLSGIAIRMAQRMGLHLDGTNYGIPPFQVEMRRRMWWQLILFDSRIAHISGSGSSVLTYRWTTKLPCNVNDSDLFLDMKELPTDHVGSTEMGFVLQRCEVLRHQVQNFEPALRSTESNNELVDKLEGTLRQRYISYCDVSIPVHAMSVMVARIAISMCRLGNRPNLLFMNLASNTPEDNERIFRHALNMVETHNQMVGNPSLQRFHWFMWSHFPLPAHIYVLVALRYQKNEELSGRAWIQIAEAYNSQTGPFSQAVSHTNLHLAVGNLVIKAWEAREIAQRKLELSDPISAVPRFISVLRNRLLEKRMNSGKKLKGNSRDEKAKNSGLGEPVGGWNKQSNSAEVIGDIGDTVDSGFQGFDQMFSGFMVQEQSMSWGVFDNLMNQDYQPGGSIF